MMMMIRVARAPHCYRPRATALPRQRMRMHKKVKRKVRMKKATAPRRPLTKKMKKARMMKKVKMKVLIPRKTKSRVRSRTKVLMMQAPQRLMKPRVQMTRWPTALLRQRPKASRKRFEIFASESRCFDEFQICLSSQGECDALRPSKLFKSLAPQQHTFHHNLVV